MLLINGTVVTLNWENAVMEGSGVLIRGSKIERVGRDLDLMSGFSGGELIDLEGRIVMPGLINCHSHLCDILLRGAPSPEEAPGDFGEVQRKIRWPLEEALTKEDIYYAGLVGLIVSVRSGTTTVMEHHNSKDVAAGLGAMERAFNEVGLRGSLCAGVTDRYGDAVAAQGLEANLVLIDRWKKGMTGKVGGAIGLDASYGLTEHTIAAIAGEAVKTDVGLHIPVAEGFLDQEDCLERFDERVVHRLKRSGILRERTLAAHCSHLDDAEVEVLLDTEAFVAHCPISDASEAAGASDVRNLLSEEICVGLGSDGEVRNLFHEAVGGLARFRRAAADPVAGLDELNHLMLRNARRIAGAFLGLKLGVIIPGAEADLIVLGYKSPTPVRGESVIAHLVSGLGGSPVHTVIVGGDVILRSGQFPHIQEEAVYRRCRQLSGELWKRMGLV
jgi:cytosine/adenosine deaminase-related metal-dependent hydrolase